MYKDKEKQREAEREASRRYRERKKGMTEGMTQYPAIVKALVDPKRRAMLEFISYDLNRKGLGRKVRYGGPDFEVISELLEATA